MTSLKCVVLYAIYLFQDVIKFQIFPFVSRAFWRFHMKNGNWKKEEIKLEIE